MGTANANALILMELMENSRKDINLLGGRGRRKRRRGQDIGPTVSSNDEDHSLLTAGNNALLGHLYANGARLVSGDETRVTLVHVGVQSTRGRRLRRHRNHHRHWRKPDVNNNNGGNKNQHQSDSIKIYRHLQTSTGNDRIGEQQPLQVACLFLPILAGAFWYWTKRRARKVATVLGNDSACATAVTAATVGRDGTGDSAEGHYRRWYGGPAGGNNNNVNVDDEVDEYCAWYNGGKVNDSFGAANADGTYSSKAMALAETAGRQLKPSTVLWIKGGPREDPRRVAGDIDLARTSSMSPPFAPRTAVEESAWQPIQDLYTRDAMVGGGLDLSSDSSYFADPYTDACSIVGSSIAGIHMPRFAPMTMDRGDRLSISCLSATPSPTGAADGGGTGTDNTA